MELARAASVRLREIAERSADARQRACRVLQTAPTPIPRPPPARQGNHITYLVDKLKRLQERYDILTRQLAELKAKRQRR